MAVAFTAGQFEVSATSNPFVTDGIEALTFDAEQAAGSLILVGVGVPASNLSISSITDDGGNTYQICSQGGTDATGEFAGTMEGWLYYSYTTNPTNTVTVTMSGATAGDAFMTIAGFDGTSATPIEDVAAAISGVSEQTHETGGVTTAAAGSMLVAWYFMSNGSYSLDADFTSLHNASLTNVALVHGYDAVNAVTADCTVTSVANEFGVKILVAIQPPGAGGGVVPVYVANLRRQGIL